MSYVEYLRSRGVQIGDGTYFQNPKFTEDTVSLRLPSDTLKETVSKFQLDPSYERYVHEHHAKYMSFMESLLAAGIE